MATGNAPGTGDKGASTEAKPSLPLAAFAAAAFAAGAVAASFAARPAHLTKARAGVWLGRRGGTGGRGVTTRASNEGGGR